jgi:hypothetical protein
MFRSVLRRLLASLLMQDIAQLADAGDHRRLWLLTRALILGGKISVGAGDVRIRFGAMGVVPGAHARNLIRRERRERGHDVLVGLALLEARNDMLQPDAMPLQADFVWRDEDQKGFWRGIGNGWDL